MEKDKSPLLSTSVSMTMMSSANSSSPVVDTKPIVLLIAGDFGFKSEAPEKVCASEWNEFCDNHSFECCCTIKNDLPAGMQPFFLEYTIKNLQDFSKKSIIEKAPIFNPYKRVLEIVQQCESGTIGASEAFDHLSRLPVAEPIKIKILQGLGYTPVRNTPSSSPVQIDSILSLLDLGDTSTNDITSNPLAQDNVSAVFSTENDPGAQFQKLHEYVSEQMDQVARAIQDSPEFRGYATRWYALKSLLKIAGRNGVLQILIASSPVDDIEESLKRILIQLSNSFNTPDVVLWGYAHTTSTASITLLEDVLTTADKHKTLLIASLDQSESLVSDITSSQPIRVIMEQDEMIPFRRLRTNVTSRSGILSVNAPYEPSDKSAFNKVDAAWIITARWIATIVSKNARFQWTDNVEPLTEFAISSAFKYPRLEEISSAGLTPAQNPAMEYHSTSPVVILDTGEESPYQSAGFNLIVNRTVRLTAEWLSINSTSDTINNRMNALRDFLISQLRPYTILSDDSSLTVEVRDQTATINVDSLCSVDNYPIRFEFSAGI